MQNKNEDEFEAYLKQFRFREPPALRMRSRRPVARSYWALRWALGVAALAAIAGLLWIGGIGLHHRTRPVAGKQTVARTVAPEKLAPMTLGRLSAMQSRSSEQIDATFMHSAAQSLPNVGRGPGVLQSLAGD